MVAIDIKGIDRQKVYERRYMRFFKGQETGGENHLYHAKQVDQVREMLGVRSYFQKYGGKRAEVKVFCCRTFGFSLDYKLG